MYCKQCGNEFSGRKKKYCSESCRYDYRNENKKHKKRCKNCNVIFMSRNSEQRFCNKKCAAYFIQNKSKLNNCSYCENKFKSKIRQKFCSDKCKYLFYKKREFSDRRCKECNKKLNHYQRIYCSKKCMNDSVRIHSYKCDYCHNKFTGQKDRANKFCSRECFYKAIGANPKEFKYNSYLTDASSIKRAKYYRVRYEKIELLEVFERDQWKCGICHEKVDNSIVWPDKKSVSLDHIIPLSKGGTHTYDNVQCSHLGCNIKKQNHLEVVVMK